MKKVLLEAPILTQSGYGEHARLVFKSLLLEPNIEIFVNPLTWGTTSWASSISKDVEEKINSSIEKFRTYVHNCQVSGIQPTYDTHIHVGIPSEYTAKSQHSVCVTAGIETDRVASEWLFRTHRGMTKLVVPSEHAKQGFVTTSYEVFNKKTEEKSILNCTCPVDVVPYPVKSVEKKELDFTTDTEFNFLSIALMGPRKNIHNMVNWFIQEFKNENIGLILKTGLSSGGAMDKSKTVESLAQIMSQHPDRTCKIYLLHGDLEESELHSLYNREDVHAYISATHGEGYGLPIFEAACYGMPVVATNWSAHTEFLTAPYKEGGKVKDKKLFAKVDFDLGVVPKQAVWKDIIVEESVWAYPKENSFKKQLRNVYKNYGMYKKWAKVLKETIHENYSEQSILIKMKESLLSVGPSTSDSQEQEEQLIVL